MKDYQVEHLISVLDRGVDALRDIDGHLFSIWLALWLIFVVLVIRTFLLSK